MSLFKKSITNVPMLDLRKYTPQAFENLRCIKNVAKLIKKKLSIL